MKSLAIFFAFFILFTMVNSKPLVSEQLASETEPSIANDSPICDNGTSSHPCGFAIGEVHVERLIDMKEIEDKIEHGLETVKKVGTSIKKAIEKVVNGISKVTHLPALLIIFGLAAIILLYIVSKCCCCCC